jgi:hypothetical protein
LGIKGGDIMEVTFYSRKLKKNITFFKNYSDNDRSNIYANLNNKVGTLGKQITDKKENAIQANDKDFEQVCKKWLKSYIADL